MTPPVLSSNTIHTATRTLSFWKASLPPRREESCSYYKLLKTRATVNAATMDNIASMVKPSCSHNQTQTMHFITREC